MPGERRAQLLIAADWARKALSTMVTDILSQKEDDEREIQRLITRRVLRLSRELIAEEGREYLAWSSKKHGG